MEENKTPTTEKKDTIQIKITPCSDETYQVQLPQEVIRIKKVRTKLFEVSEKLKRFQSQVYDVQRYYCIVGMFCAVELGELCIEFSQNGIDFFGEYIMPVKPNEKNIFNLICAGDYVRVSFKSCIARSEEGDFFQMVVYGK